MDKTQRYRKVWQGEEFGCWDEDGAGGVIFPISNAVPNLFPNKTNADFMFDK